MISSFAELGLAAPLARALDAAGYVTPTPIQAGAIPHLVEGRDLLGLAQTGTGKTAAFVLPILERLRSAGTKAAPLTARALILAPTRELAIQIHETVRTLSKNQHFSHAAVFGGVSINPQIAILRKGVDVLIATPGRLNDLIKQRCLTLADVRFFVLDEADRMLDMGFIRDVKRIVAGLPKERQSMLFSATMPQAIGDIAASLLRNPVQVEVRPEEIAVDRIDQRLVHLPQSAKREALLTLLGGRDVTRALVFARTKHGANRISGYLDDYGCKTAAIHGNKSQAARQKALASFKSGEVTVLVATDIAARGIDVANISHVINAELPDEPESYVHRIGRTARAGREGVAITLCDPSERDKLRAVERLLKRPIPTMTIEGLDLNKPRDAAKISEDRKPHGAGRPRRGERAPRRPDAHASTHGRGPAARDDRRQDDHRADHRHGDPRHGDPRRVDNRAGERRRDERPRDEAVQKAGLPRFLDRRPGEQRQPSAEAGRSRQDGARQGGEHQRSRDGARPGRSGRNGRRTFGS